MGTATITVKKIYGSIYQVITLTASGCKLSKVFSFLGWNSNIQASYNYYCQVFSFQAEESHCDENEHIILPFIFFL